VDERIEVESFEQTQNPPEAQAGWFFHWAAEFGPQHRISNLKKENSMSR
jgi:hypothetical protein